MHKEDCKVVWRNADVIPAEEFDGSLKKAWGKIGSEPELYAAVSHLSRIRMGGSTDE